MRHLLFSLLAVLVATTLAPVPADAAKQKWFACPQGYTLKTSGTRYARCAKAPNVQRRVPGCVGLNIPGLTVGAKLRINATGRADKCVVANTPTMATPLCPPAFRLIVKQGRDECRRIIRQPPKPVARPVMR